MRHLALPLCLCAAALAGCDALGIESSAKLAERKQAEAHAIGSACRHAIRSVEDCFKTNPKAGKAAVFAGWKEMDQYMRDNQIVGMPSTAVTDPPADAEATDSEGAPVGESADETPKKSSAAKPGADKTTSDVKTVKS
jgi:hypothetical protein